MANTQTKGRNEATQSPPHDRRSGERTTTAGEVQGGAVAQPPEPSAPPLATASGSSTDVSTRLNGPARRYDPPTCSFGRLAKVSIERHGDDVVIKPPPAVLNLREELPRLVSDLSREELRELVGNLRDGYLGKWPIGVSPGRS
jgi:hypothetical protein